MRIVKTEGFSEDYQQSYPHLVDNFSPNNYILFFVEFIHKCENPREEREVPVEKGAVIHILGG